MFAHFLHPAKSHAAKPSFAQQEPHCLQQGDYIQAYYTLVPLNPYGAFYTAAQGSAGYAYQTTDPSPAPIASTTGFTPPRPHNTKTRESGHSSIASIDAPYPVSPLVSCLRACS